MKKVILVLLITAAATNVFPQIEKGNIIFSLSGNYLKSGDENGVTTNLFKTNSKNLNLGISIGCFITDKFVTGIGLDYNWINESTSSNIFINRFIQYERADIKKTVLLATIYSGYYYPILNNLYINPNFKVSLGTIRSEDNSIIVGRTLISGEYIYVSDDDMKYFNYVRSTVDNSKIDFFGVGIIPEITYFFSGNFGLNLCLGGLEYSFTDWDFQNSNWLVDFRPSFWKFGIKVRFNNAS